VNNKRNEVYLKAFGEHLRLVRKQKKFSQEDLALEADITFSQIGRIERGIINPTISTILVIAQALDVHPKTLFDFEFKE